MKDIVPIDPSSELSVENVLANIRFRGELGFKLKDYNFAPNFTSVELEFVPCAGGGKAKKPN